MALLATSKTVGLQSDRLYSVHCAAALDQVTQCYAGPVVSRIAQAAQLIRSAKSGSDWTDVQHLYIPTSPSVFFQSISLDPSFDHLDPDIFTSPFNADFFKFSYIAAHYLGHLDLATQALGTQEGAIDDFAAATLRLLDFDERYSTATLYL